jgi:hypothetical protein
MLTTTRNLNPVAGALLAGTLAWLVAPLVPSPLAFLAVVPAAIFGATRFARPLAPTAFALTCGLLAGHLVLLVAGIASLGLILALVPFAVTTIGVSVAIWRAELDFSMRIGRGLVTLQSRRGA